jgi:hypothetical protein
MASHAFLKRAGAVLLLLGVAAFPGFLPAAQAADRVVLAENFTATW